MIMATFDARDLKLDVDKAKLKALYQTQPARHAVAILMNWAIILLSAYVCSRYFHPALYVLAVLIIGARMHALAILMHDAAHYRFLKNRKWSDLITNISSMYFLFTSVEIYRESHLLHHQHLNTEGDPIWVMKLGRREYRFPKSKKEFLLILFSYLFLIQGIRDIIWFTKSFPLLASSKKGPTRKSLMTQTAFYGLLIGFLSVMGIWEEFALYWMIPYLSSLFMFQYIRSVSEHFGELSYDHLLTSSRTVKTNLIERFFIAPHNVGYHLEHHLYPGVPYYHLPRLHKLLMDLLPYRSKAHITQGYLLGLINELGPQEKV